ncbi:hypothetical protein Xbed_01499 [Xenorhabdus beddingii]|uniref:Uncharacterized protein n=1 Tax=Xenorhabdus beddingii TaxID=40578 RepID=A0A1Y2SNB6_9GAMM|nr:hypothetical protein [Xenorhabdus beddingii]OTA20469.1 hypothetical protein Xbed_01499 [Xenorhabdus beddingii]
MNNNNAHALIGRTVCQLLETDSLICSKDVVATMTDIFNAEYQGVYDELCESYNQALLMLTRDAEHPRIIQ